MKNIHVIGKELFITSDEEIKEGDWLIVNDEDVMQMKSSYDNDMSGEDIWVGDSLNGYATYKDNCKKIILTTDQDLIKDGVQDIDDEFLEWFVNNPSCEEVEFKINYSNSVMNYSYKIIIPEQEPKQETLEEVEIISKQRIHKYRPMKPHPASFFIGFRAGAEWQQERMYSEEDVQVILSKLLFDLKHKGIPNSVDWFEQFKKK